MKESYEARRLLLQRYEELEQYIKEYPNDRFKEGEKRGLRIAIDIIDGDLYYSEKRGWLNR